VFEAGIVSYLSTRPDKSSLTDLAVQCAACNHAGGHDDSSKHSQSTAIAAVGLPAPLYYSQSAKSIKSDHRTWMFVSALDVQPGGKRLIVGAQIEDFHVRPARSPQFTAFDR
jgi:hypothetical protein